jgi:anaerobic ribonucleoside-triphosphate reductase
VLIKSGKPAVAKAYILYRQQRAEVRNARRMILDAEALVEDYLQRADWRVNENSNMNYSLQGLNFYIASSIAARYWLQKVYPVEVQNAHIAGDFHIHDLGMLSTYCCGWDLQDLLRIGFGGVPAMLESKPPKHFRTALGQLVNFFYTMQGESAGAQAMSSFDTLLAPFVRYDGLDYASVKQAMQEFIFNINVPTRVGFQTPFTNVTFDLVPSPVLRDEPVIVGGELGNETYGDFQREMDMINRAFAEVMLEGDAKGRVFTFPIPTYNITREFDWDNPVLEPIWRMTAKYGIPYFSNFINSDMRPEDARSMCCRLRLDNRELRKRGGGLFGANPLTGSIGVVTVNLPRLGYLSENEDEFFSRLGQAMEKAKTSLEIKRKILEQLTEQGLYPYSRHYLSSVKQSQGAYWANHFSTIGLNGMNEACLNFLGVGVGDPAGKAFAVRVLAFMRECLTEYQEQTLHLYNLEATPAEGATYRLAKLDKTEHPEIIAAGTDDVPYYTNSTHLPVGYTPDIFEALEHQDDLQVLYTGGTVFHGFVGEQIDDWRQARLLVRRIAERYRLPYYTLTPTFSICPVHGYIAGEHPYCPYEHSEEDLERFGIEPG